MYKKIIPLILLLALLFPSNTEAKTIAQLEAELEKEKQALKENKEEEKITESQMTSINSNIKKIQDTITSNYEKINVLNKEIQNLNKEIELKEKEIKEIINFAQVSDGDSAYLEYMFGASDFTDFIYRSAVSEQLSSYNSKVIDEHNAKIKANKDKTKELEKQKKELDKQQKNLESQYSSLGNRLMELADTKVDIEDAIKQQEETIKNYKKMGCGDNEELQACLNRLHSLPPDTQFWRPLNSAKITSRYGYRPSIGDNHQGLDMSAKIGTPVYAVANGVVISTYEVGGTGKAVYINHTVNGKKYTSVYMHLSRYNVKFNDVVTKDTIIGYSGNTGFSTGPHLHLGILSGHAGPGKDYGFWSSTFYRKFIDPASVINFPKGYKSFKDRTTAY